MRPGHVCLAMALGLAASTAGVAGPADARQINFYGYPNCGPAMQADPKTKTCVMTVDEPASEETCTATTEGTSSATGQGTGSLVWGQGTTASGGGYTVGGPTVYQTQPPAKTALPCKPSSTASGAGKKASARKAGSKTPPVTSGGSRPH